MTTALSSVRDPVTFISTYIKVNELGRPFALFPHQKEVLRLAFQFDESGRLPYDTIIWSCPKKSGKTTINAAVTCWWAFTQEAPNELLILANDLEQAQARVFKTMVALIEKNPQLASSAKTQMKQVEFSNGSSVTALANEYKSDAGSNQGWSSWDELWAYDSESALRLWEELTPVPTRNNSIRFITTYAGFESESSLLRGLYLVGAGKGEHPDGQGERLHPTLPIYGNRDARVFCYWDHEPRLPWQTEAYRTAQRKVLRPTTFTRLHDNAWTSAASAFITPELWDPCVDRNLNPLLLTHDDEVTLGIDIGIKNDNAAVEGVCRNETGLVQALHRLWKPSRAEPLDLQAVEEYVLNLHTRARIHAYYDPYQFHGSAMRLRAAGVRIDEFPQTSANCTRMGQTLFELLTGKHLRLLPFDDLRAQALNTIAIESARGWRIAKEKASRKIDAIVALSMACVGALDQPVSGPLLFFCNGQQLGASVPTSSPVVPAPLEGAALLRVNPFDLKHLSPAELQERAGLVAAATRDDTQFEARVRQRGSWFPGD